MLLFNLQDLTILPENGLLVPIVKANIRFYVREKKIKDVVLCTMHQTLR
jgi:hypothetical protein